MSESAPATALPPSPRRPRFRVRPDLTRLPVGQNLEVVYNPATKEVLTLSPVEVKLLFTRSSFSSVEEHADYLCGRVGIAASHLNAVRERLYAFIKSEFIFENNVSGETENGLLRPRQQISWICVPTRNRSESLQTCVQSFAQNANTFKRNIKFLIVDQTEDLTQLELNKQSVAATTSRFGIEAWFADPTQVRAFAARLSEHANLPADLVEFACCGDEQFQNRVGASRNALLLATAGELMLQVDDDTVCTLEPCPEADDGFSVLSEYTCTEFWFPSAAELSQRSQIPASLDICALHEELIGKTLDECIADYGVPCNGPSRKGSLRGRVLATTVGISGDVGVDTRLWQLMSSGLQRDRLIRSEDAYRHTVNEGQVLKCVRQRTISDAGLVSGANVALDNRDVLPPFLPVQRSEDSVFTVLLHACFRSYVGFLPWMVDHNRAGRRDTSQETARPRSHLLSGDLVWLMISELDKELTAVKPAARMEELGALFVKWGTAPPAELRELLRILAMTNNSRLALRLTRLLAKHKEKPEFWASDLRQYLAWVQRTTADSDIDITTDLFDAFGAEARSKFQQLVLNFGQLLEIWPKLHTAARELRAQGVSLGTRL